MSNTIRHINKSSDFDFILELEAGDTQGGTQEVGFPEYDFKAKLRTSGYAEYPFSCVDGECVNCYNDDGKIHVVVNNHSLPVGMLTVEFVAEIPNAIYPDGSRRVVTPKPIGIELWNKASDDASDIEVSYILPYIKGDKGDAFTYADFTQEQLDDMTASIVKQAEPKVDAVLEKVTAAESKMEQAESERVAAEQSRVQAEQKRSDAETARVSAESSRVEAENARANAESLRASAETSRADAEQKRVDAETARVNAESSRATTEGLRVDAEQKRVEAETLRVEAESKRVSEFTELSEQSKTATQSAKDAAQYATEQGDYAKQQGALIDETLSGIAEILDTINGEEV